MLFRSGFVNSWQSQSLLTVDFMSFLSNRSETAIFTLTEIKKVKKFNPNDINRLSITLLPSHSRKSVNGCFLQYVSILDNRKVRQHFLRGQDSHNSIISPFCSSLFSWSSLGAIQRAVPKEGERESQETQWSER